MDRFRKSGLEEVIDEGRARYVRDWRPPLEGLDTHPLSKDFLARLRDRLGEPTLFGFDGFTYVVMDDVAKRTLLARSGGGVDGVDCPTELPCFCAYELDDVDRGAIDALEAWLNAAGTA